MISTFWSTFTSACNGKYVLWSSPSGILQGPVSLTRLLLPAPNFIPLEFTQTHLMLGDPHKMFYLPPDITDIFITRYYGNTKLTVPSKCINWWAKQYLKKRYRLTKKYAASLVAQILDFRFVDRKWKLGKSTRARPTWHHTYSNLFPSCINSYPMEKIWVCPQP